MTIDFYEYANFTGSSNIQLPFSLNADYTVTIDFQFLTYINDQHAFGNSSSATRIHLTEYSNKWYTSTGTSETNYSPTNYPLGDRHTFINNLNNSNYMDGDVVTSYTPYTNSSIYYQVGGRNGDYNFRGNIYSFKIESISTGDLICELLPAKDATHEGLYDTVNDVWYGSNVTVYNLLSPHYYIEFNDGSGNTATQTIYVGEATTLDENTFTKAYNSFIGWDTSSSATTVVYDDEEVVTDIAQEDETLPLYAVWQPTRAVLIGDEDGKLYTIIESGGSQVLSELTGVSTLTASVFQTYGFQFNPPSSLLVTLDSPKVYLWDDTSAQDFTADVVATPVSQTITSQINLNIPYVVGIDSIEAEYEGNVSMSYSYDNSNWTTMTMANFLQIDLDTLYNGLSSSKILYIKVILQDANASFGSFTMNYKRQYS